VILKKLEIDIKKLLGFSINTKYKNINQKITKVRIFIKFGAL
jgi:hypothetical protein